MPTITIVGLGPGPLGWLTKEAESELLGAEKIFFRTSGHPAYEWLKERGKHVVCFDRLYTTAWTEPGEIYEFMVSALLKEAELRGKVTYALPGSPFF
jgi:tetrapyrrole methylase family protein / MazG family protein